MNNNNQKQQQQPDNSDSNKKESTNSGGNDETSTSSSKPKDILHEDLCSICFDDVSILDIHSFTICTECGKVMHKKCDIQLMNAKGLSAETRNSCPMCRATIVALGFTDLEEDANVSIIDAKKCAMYKVELVKNVGSPTLL